MNNQQLSNNTLALIALCNEYRQSAEQARDLSRDGFIDAVLRLLPRIYIAVTDVPQSPDGSEMFMQDALDEDYYDSVRRQSGPGPGSPGAPPRSTGRRRA